MSLPYAYDANGNLSTETTSASTTTRTFDEDNRMTAQSLGAATLSYDAASRLSKTIINGTETQLLYDGTNLVAEYNSTGTLLKRYVHSNGIDEPIVVYDGATTTNKNWFYADHLGSIVALANTTGTATATYTYSAEGKQAGSAGSRFGYTGQQNLGGLGVQYYKARMYSADLGRFIQTDPIGMADDMNLYAYVGNNAVNRMDPSGNWTLQIGFAGTNTDGTIGALAGVGFAIDTKGNYGFYGYGGPGGGIGLNEGYGVSVQLSNAPVIDGLKDKFTNYSLSGGVVAGGTLDGFHGDYNGNTVRGGGFTFGEDVGASLMVGTTKTYLSNQGNIFSDLKNYAQDIMNNYNPRSTTSSYK